MKTKKTTSSTYLVAKYLQDNPRRSYIHAMKKVCKCNNVPQRIMQLRKTFNWQIESILEGYVDGVAVYHYRLTLAAKMPEQFN